MYTSIHRPRSLSACSEDSTLGPYPEAIIADAKTEVKPAAVGNVAPPSSSSRRQSSSSAALSERSCGAMSSRGMRELWLCMLELQETYGCYKSTRMALAMGSGDDPTALMPSRFIIDTLNDSLWDLPQEGWEKLDRCLRHEDLSSKTSSKL